jgi:hypothetical protein
MKYRPIGIAEKKLVQPGWIIFNKAETKDESIFNEAETKDESIFNEVETKDLCTVRDSSTSKKVFYFVALKFAGLPDHLGLIHPIN